MGEIDRIAGNTTLLDRNYWMVHTLPLISVGAGAGEVINVSICGLAQQILEPQLLLLQI